MSRGVAGSLPSDAIPGSWRGRRRAYSCGVTSTGLDPLRHPPGCSRRGAPGFSATHLGRRRTNPLTTSGAVSVGRRRGGPDRHHRRGDPAALADRRRPWGSKVTGRRTSTRRWRSWTRATPGTAPKTAADATSRPNMAPNLLLAWPRTYSSLVLGARSSPLLISIGFGLLAIAGGYHQPWRRDSQWWWSEACSLRPGPTQRDDPSLHCTPPTCPAIS